jgi:Methylamine utilisation protein MauE
MDEFSIVVLCLAGGVFAASSAAKLSGRRAYRSFRDGLKETRLIPRRVLPAAAASLAGAEAVGAAGLLAGAGLAAAGAPGAAWLAGAALTAAVLLTAVLALGVGVVVRRGTRVACACFGTGSSHPLGRVHLARNLCLLGVACAGLACVPLAHGRPSVGAALVAAASGAVAALLFARWDDLAGLFARLPAAETARPAAQAGPRPARMDS